MIELIVKQVGRKRVQTIIAFVIAFIMILSGTYAWVTISAVGLNEMYDLVNPGGRLHDDYDGENKDIYVENFGDVPILVRVRLDEYLEIGGNAIKTANSAATVLKSDSSTWTTFNPFLTDATKNVSNGHADLVFGGQKWFMPTFNKSFDNLNPDRPNPRIDINFKADPTDLSAQVPWDGTPGENIPQYRRVKDGSYKADLLADIVGTGKEATYGYWDPGVHDDKTDKELIWDSQANGGNGATIDGEAETHYSAQTKYATVISMAQWETRMQSTTTANRIGEHFWVYDDDGWAYWSEPLYPGEATGLLLSSMKFNGGQSKNWYYAINAVAQFATADEYEAKFNADDESNTAGAIGTKAKALMVKALAGLTPGTVYKDAMTNLDWRVLEKDAAGRVLLIYNDYTTATAYNGSSQSTFQNYATVDPLNIKTVMNNWYTSNAGFLADYDLKWTEESIPVERTTPSAYPSPVNNWGAAWEQALSTAGSDEASDYAGVVFPLSISDIYAYGPANIGGKNTINFNIGMWLRSPGTTTGSPQSVWSSAGASFSSYNTSSAGYYIRPALWTKASIR